jgi:hypothetical protein
MHKGFLKFFLLITGMLELYRYRCVVRNRSQISYFLSSGVGADFWWAFRKFSSFTVPLQYRYRYVMVLYIFGASMAPNNGSLVRLPSWILYNNVVLPTDKFRSLFRMNSKIV